MKDYKELGEFLRKRRQELGLTQKQVAEALGYSFPNFISMIENGYKVPLKRYKDFAKVLKLDERETLMRFLMIENEDAVNTLINLPKLDGMDTLLSLITSFCQNLSKDEKLIFIEKVMELLDISKKEIEG
ncbi:MAG: hypothetical protein DRG20_06730 [Deltaproteobacteria bacterium]|nr:MAG: hypothetical protein DRG20_06730 [Deltaproteobacteria bacterium]